MKKITKLLALLLAVVMVLSCIAGCKKKPTTDPTDGANAAKAEYTYRGYTQQMGTNWNPHTWEVEGDNAILSYLETPLVTMSVKDSAKSEYQWVYKAATSVTDVTKDHKDDLTKYKVTLPAGQTAEQTEKGYVFEIKLNPNMKWQDGTVINADSYIYSMKALLDPTMMNYRANLYYDGESAVAGGNTYYNSGAPIYEPVVAPYGEGETPDYSFDLDKGIQDGKVYISVSSEKMTLAGYSLNTLINDYNPKGAEFLKKIGGEANPYGYTKVTAENLQTVKELVGAAIAPFGMVWADMSEADQKGILMEALFVFNDKYGEKAEYDGTVGCYKVDDYTIRYVTQAAIDINYFLTSCTSNWLVHKETYEKGFDTTGALKTTNYGTDIATTMSYGAYKLESLQKGKQVVFVQNENYYQYTKNADGTLSALTDYDVDGKKVTAYQTTKVVIDVMTDEAAKQAFLKGQLSEWTPTADEMANYSTSDQMRQVDETYTQAFFFNSDVKALQEMDKSKGNQNSVVLSNDNFRKAFSLAMDRKDWVTATPGYKPSYSLMNELYYYDIYNDPTSTYRSSPQAMQAICDVYGVKWVDGAMYGTLEEAYGSITGYNLTEAKDLMKTACDELVKAGLYKKGEEIKIRIAYSAGPLSSANHNQVAKVNQYLNAAMEGSGFGKITLEAIGDIPSRHDKVPGGEYAIGYGAWGGAAFYPFRNMQCYCDTEQYSLNELGCWDPTTETLKIKVDGEDVTMTWQDWSVSMTGTGPYADADNETKLAVLAAIEEAYLELYYCIPIATTTSCSMLSYKLSYFTEDYNIMYGFGGLRLIQPNYNDAEWTEYVASVGGTLSYE